VEEEKENNDRHDIYKNIFFYLGPCFPSVNRKVIEKLSIAGYSYFRFLLLIDQIVDNPSKVNKRERSPNSSKAESMFAQLSCGLTLHERSIRKLAAIFQEDSQFWEGFEEIKTVYREAVRSEKDLSFNPERYTKSTFEEIAAGKSAVSRAAVLALCTLSGRDEVQEELERMLIRYHQGLQILDDVDDFRSDVQSGQPTWAIARVDAYLEKHGDDPAAVGSERKYRYFFVSGIASSLLQEAKTYFQEAITLAQKRDLHDIEQRFEEKLHRCKRHGWEIDRLIEKTKMKVQLESAPARPPSEVDAGITDKAVQKGMGFLGKMQADDGGWSDFLTSAGAGTQWVSSYVGYQLAEADIAPELTSCLRSGRTSDDTIGAYNETMIQDGDSMAFWIGFLYEKTGSVPEAAIEKWSQYCDDRGGWRTYLEGGALRKRLNLPSTQPVDGWLTPKPCVTAAAAAILTNMPRVEISVEQSIHRLLNLQEQKPCWGSYWWTSPIYSTSFSLRALSTYGSITGSPSDSIECSIAQASRWLRDLQHEDGSWTVRGHSSPLYTALAVKALVEAAPQATASIRKGVNWLLRSQRADGSWPTHRVLRIPATHVTDPSSVKNWRKSSFGTNVLVDDHRRVFTTATAVNSLSTAEHLVA
jgi:hypothetical protein